MKKIITLMTLILSLSSVAQAFNTATEQQPPAFKDIRASSTTCRTWSCTVSCGGNYRYLGFYYETVSKSGVTAADALNLSEEACLKKLNANGALMSTTSIALDANKQAHWKAPTVTSDCIKD